MKHKTFIKPIFQMIGIIINITQKLKLQRNNKKLLIFFFILPEILGAQNQSFNDFFIEHIKKDSSIYACSNYKITPKNIPVSISNDLKLILKLKDTNLGFTNLQFNRFDKLTLLRTYKIPKVKRKQRKEIAVFKIDIDSFQNGVLSLELGFFEIQIDKYFHKYPTGRMLFVIRDKIKVKMIYQNGEFYVSESKRVYR